MLQRLNNIFMGETENSSFQEPEFSEKEDEEWILVDFIGGLTTIEIETSPMENLLIEHPSMSVYTFPNRYHNTEESSSSPEDSHDPSTLRSDGQNEISQHIRCYVSMLAAHNAFQKQARRFHPEWAKTHKRPYLSRNRLRRQNLTRVCHSRQMKHNALFVRQPCQRRYNY